jgi:hypothetical protein
MKCLRGFEEVPSIPVHRIQIDQTVVAGAASFQNIQSGSEPARTLRAHQAQLLLAAGSWMRNFTQSDQ